MNLTDYLTDYQTASRLTALYPDRDNNLWYPTLGLIGEFHEWKLTSDPVNLAKEAGDVAWYCAQICAELQVGLEVAIETALAESQESVVLMTLAESVKKWHRDGAAPDKKTKILACVGWIWQQVLARDTQAETIAILEANINKLRDRQQRGVLQGSGDDR
jgi:hypothetical protein